MSDIQLENYYKIIKKRNILTNINLTFKEGQIYGITGPNGSGKSMLLRSLLGIIRPTKGKLLINEKAVDFSEIYPLNTGILIDKPAFVPSFTAEKNLEMLRLLNNNIPKEEIASALAEVQILNLQKRKVSEFSLGQQQKLGLAEAFFGSPELLVLDEPTNALDEASIANLIKLLKEKNQAGVTIIISSHDKQFLTSLTEKIYEINNGTIEGGG